MQRRLRIIFNDLLLFIITSKNKIDLPHLPLKYAESLWTRTFC